MATNTRVMRGVTPDQVWAVLTDGETYGHWVVGTRRVHEVDGRWPQPPAELHYTVGWAPLRKDGTTRSLAYDPGQRLVMRAHAWPAGTARIALQVSPGPEGAVVTIEEAPDGGPGRLLHNPLSDLAIKARNVETLRRLERLARSRRPARG